jgi:hypothetical protein
MASDNEPQQSRPPESVFGVPPGDSADAAMTLTDGLLAHVLEQTLLERAADRIEASASAAARAVGRKHAGSPLVLDPVLIELVEALLLDQFQRAFPRENWRVVATEVAQRLFDDPGSQARLQQFWQRLPVSSHDA